ncbi:hypothetical protein [Mesorhizobium sp. NZP2077]|uniref:hypothetical protein n=1 Tax=Mesorhizobium sp. NZP2077 TaxID=2483404 RepID=UPI00155601B8|nr:hypothetical protein [Mesorhizobium sp. NZP2077]QKD18032.1 hypothetical protein HGP13_25000 [Mesorhizobium sp. NZP2077]
MAATAPARTEAARRVYRKQPAHAIADAIVNAERFLDHLGIAHETVFLPDAVAVMGLGRLASAVQDELQPHGLDRATYLERSQRELWSHIAKVHFPEIRVEMKRLRSDNSRLAEEIERKSQPGRTPKCPA